MYCARIDRRRFVAVSRVAELPAVNIYVYIQVVANVTISNIYCIHMSLIEREHVWRKI